MQPQVSPSPATRALPGPREVPRRQPPPKRRAWPWIVSITLVVVVLAAGLAYWRRAASSKQAVPATALSTATVTSGRLERTLRLSGTTGSANFAGLITPQLRGSRSGFHRDA